MMGEHYPEASLLGSGTHFDAIDTGDAYCILKIPRVMPLFSGTCVLGGVERGWLRNLLISLRRHRKLSNIRKRLRELLVEETAERRTAFGKVIIPSEWCEMIDITYDDGNNLRRYRGWAIRQARAEVFDNGTGLNTFSWAEITDRQLALWQLGLGLGAAAEAWGPKNWGRTLDGHIGLVDFSHVIDDIHATAALRVPVQRERRRMALHAGQPSSCQKLVSSYIDFVEAALSVDVLKRSWGKWDEKHKTSFIST